MSGGPALAGALALCGVLTSPGECAPSSLTETARFLAGKGVAADSKLAQYAQTPFYSDYAEQIRSGWRRFQEPNLEHIRSWWARYAPARYSTVLYPFSGPDIANALTLFPNADSYVLFGLESPGSLPDPEAMDEDAVRASLNDLKASLSTILQVNYFLTKRMEKKLGRETFNSVTALLLFFLAMNDCEVTGARRIAIGPGAALVPGAAGDDSIDWRSAPRSRVPGVELTFKRSGGKMQTVRYFRVNVTDASLARSSPDFLPYLKGLGRFATLIKSAAYLMHKEGAREPTRFDQMRSLILAQSDYLVQDDSGLPLRLFARDEWKLRFHGKYDGPTPEFGKYLQKDLRIEMERNSTGRLPFSYGYEYKPGDSNLMTAERIQ
jgi:hypothetical protein